MYTIMLISVGQCRNNLRYHHYKVGGDFLSDCDQNVYLLKPRNHKRQRGRRMRPAELFWLPADILESMFLWLGCRLTPFITSVSGGGLCSTTDDAAAASSMVTLSVIILATLTACFAVHKSRQRRPCVSIKFDGESDRRRYTTRLTCCSNVNGCS